jgi:hypothetical protein
VRLRHEEEAKRIAFLWFMVVLRNRIGLLEDRFFAAVFLGSGLFTAVAVSRRLLDTFYPGTALQARVTRIE